MVILLTRGTSLIGSNTVRFLAEQGREVVVYDLLRRETITRLAGGARRRI
jgi:UDP-glucose 4-epimerase